MDFLFREVIAIYPMIMERDDISTSEWMCSIGSSLMAQKKKEKILYRIDCLFSMNLIEITISIQKMNNKNFPAQM